MKDELKNDICYNMGYVIGRLENVEDTELRQELKDVMLKIHEIALNHEIKKKCPNCNTNTSNKELSKTLYN